MNLFDTAIESIISIETYRYLQIQQVESRLSGSHKVVFLQHLQQSNLSCLYAKYNFHLRMHCVMTDPQLYFVHSREHVGYLRK